MLLTSAAGGAECGGEGGDAMAARGVEEEDVEMAATGADAGSLRGGAVCREDGAEGSTTSVKGAAEWEGCDAILSREGEEMDGYTTVNT